jgi:hypothetical protein
MRQSGSVEPTRSANSTVASFLSSVGRLSVTGAAHPGQKRAPAGISVPQRSQTAMPRLSLTSSGTSATGESLGEPAVRSAHLETPKPTALAHGARLREPAKLRQGMVWQRALFVGEIVDEFCTVVVVLAHVVVVDRLLDQLSGADERVDGVGSSVS